LNTKKTVKILSVSVLSLLFIGMLISTVSASTAYVSGFQAPYAAFSTINGYSGSGSYKFTNPQDHTQWNMAYDITDTTATFTPTDSTGNAHSPLAIAMGGISFSNGVATAPEEIYNWNITKPNGNINVYSMALYPLTWSVDFQTTGASFEHIYDYLNYPVVLTITLNQGMWYFASQPTNVYFGIGAITLLNNQVVSTAAKVPVSYIGSGLLKKEMPLTVNSPAQTTVLPTDIGDLLTITSPTNGMTAADAFYSYEGQALNPEMFAPSVTVTGINIANLASSQYETWLGVYSGANVNVHLTFTVDTFVVGDWVVQPTYRGTTIPTGISVNLPVSLSLGDIFLIVIAIAIVAVIAYIAYKVHQNKGHRKR
jgi:hypothetical protein